MDNDLHLIKKNNSEDKLNKDFELSHIIGINSEINSPLQCHPTMIETILYSVGGIVIVEDLCEKNNQVFFRHGSKQVSSFRISNTGRFLAVGFSSGKNNLDKKHPVSIILWDYENKEIIYELTGLNKAISMIEFSQDDKFLSAYSLENSFFIWEIETGFKCYSRIYEFPLSLIYWTTMTNSSRPEYTLTLAGINGLNYIHLFFELKSLQYNSKQSNFTLPSFGFVRNFTCALLDEEFNLLYMGTSGGEIAYFSMDNLIFKSSFNAINNGVNALLLSNQHLIVGGGDGRVKRISREGDKINTLKHVVTHEIELGGRVTSLSLSADKKEVVCSLSTGYVYRILVSDFTYTLHSIAHHTSVNEIAFNYNQNSTSNEKCFTVDDRGHVSMWDLNDFNLLARITSDFMAKSITIGDDDSIFVGYSNGSLKNFNIMTDESQLIFVMDWTMPAHRGNVNTIYVDPNYILTGGEDGVVRVWARTNHELIMQLPAHQKNVFKVFPDANKPNVIYSCGEDRNLNIFDLKIQKKINNHSVKNGHIRGIIQKLEQENEIISCGYNTNLKVWDFFEVQPIGEININDNFFCIRLSNSGKYFAMGSEYGDLWLFKLPDFEFIGKSIGHSSQVSSIAWSPDDKQIISTSIDGSVCVWNFYKN